MEKESKPAETSKDITMELTPEQEEDLKLYDDDEAFDEVMEIDF